MAAARVCGRDRTRAYYQSVMQRGYAVAKESGGKIIKSVSQISANDDVKIEFADGNAVCKVCEVNQIER